MSRGCRVGAGETGLLGGPSPLVAELGVELAHLPEQLEGLLGGLLVEPLQREADVDDRVVADLDVGHVGEAHLLGHAAEVDLRELGAVLLVDLDDLTGNC